MARSTQYRPLGVGVASLPGVNFVATGTAQARVAQNIAQSLDQMSRFAFQQYETQAKIEGAEYGAANAPSVAELLKAQDASAREALIPGGTDTVRGRAERQAALDTVQNNLEIAARDAINNISNDGFLNYTNIVDFQNQIDGVINGFSGAMSDVDPSSGAKLRLNLSSLGNSAYTAHIKMMAEKAEEQDEYIAKKGIDQIVDNIGQQVFNAASKGPEEMRGIIMNEKTKLVTFANSIEDPTALTSGLENFDKAVSEAQLNIVSEYVLRNPLKNSQEILDTITTGKIKVTDNAVATVMMSLDADQRLQAFSRANTAVNDFYAQDAAIEARAERQRKNQIRDLKADLTEALINGTADDEDVRAKIIKLRDLDPDQASQFNEAYFVKGGFDDLDTVLLLDQKGMDGFLTVDDILTARSERKLTLQTARNYLTVVKTNRDSLRKQAIDRIKNALGVADLGMLTLDPTGERSEAAKFVMQGMVELDEAIRDNPNLDRIAWADNFIKKGNTQKRLKDELSAALGVVNKIKKDQLGMASAKTDTEDDLNVLINQSSSILDGSPDTHQNKHNELLDAISSIRRIRAALEQ